MNDTPPGEDVPPLTPAEPPGTPEPSDASGVSDTPGTPEVSDIPDASEPADTPDAPGVSDTPGTPEVSDIPDASEPADTPDAPEVSDTPYRGGAPQVVLRRGPRRTPGARPAVQASPRRDVHDPDGVRLQKVLAGAGYGSRRACEEIIAEGRVTVDGQRVRQLGVRVDPALAVVHVDGVRLQLDTSKVTMAMNKPEGVVCTMYDPEGRRCLTDYLPERSERLFHVGRLDQATEGLLLLTNDGELANRLTHPSWEVPKTYMATVRGTIPRTLGRRLRSGIELEDGPVSVDSFRVVQTAPGMSLVEVVLHSGRNRIVRRMMEEVGHPVVQLVRTRVGPVDLGSLRPGRTRVLNRVEVGSLMAAVGM